MAHVSYHKRLQDLHKPCFKAVMHPTPAKGNHELVACMRLVNPVPRCGEVSIGHGGEDVRALLHVFADHAVQLQGDLPDLAPDTYSDKSCRCKVQCAKLPFGPSLCTCKVFLSSTSQVLAKFVHVPL